MCSIAAGIVYPVYASCKALDGGSAPEKSHWLAYWVAFGGFSAVEAFLAQRFPGYYHLKLLLLLWLQSRRYSRPLHVMCVSESCPGTSTAWAGI